jgi:hypothetical protein
VGLRRALFRVSGCDFFATLSQELAMLMIIDKAKVLRKKRGQGCAIYNAQIIGVMGHNLFDQMKKSQSNCWAISFLREHYWIERKNDWLILWLPYFSFALFLPYNCIL